MTKKKRASQKEKYKIITELVKQNEFLNSYFELEGKVSIQKQKDIGEQIEQVIVDTIAHFLLNGQAIKIGDLFTLDTYEYSARNGFNQILKKKLVEEGMSEQEAKEQCKIVIPATKTLRMKTDRNFKQEIKES